MRLCAAQTGVMMHVSKRVTEIAGLVAILYAAAGTTAIGAPAKGSVRDDCPVMS